MNARTDRVTGRKRAPLLSMCIPTRNRAGFLAQTLDCIVRQRVFVETDLVEIVISDNCSTDNTKDVALDFQRRFPEKILYVRTRETTHSSVNFANVLRHAQGKLCKLHNDAVSVFPGFLEDAIALIERNANEQQLLFFLNGNTRCADATTLCASMDDFVSHVSFYMTWIGGFALWKEDIARHSQLFIEYTHHFSQTEILLNFLMNKRGIVVYNTKFGEEYPGVSKPVTSRFLEDVYIGEYIPLIYRYVEQRHMLKTIYAREVRRMIALYYIPHYYRLQKWFSLSFVNDFVFLRKYLSFFKYCMILCLYPLYVCLHRFHDTPAFRMPISLVRNVLHD